jgi:DNA-binding transcriptional MocR family regulator
MEPIDVADRMGQWSAGRGPLYLLLAARLRELIDDGELPPGQPLPPDRALAAALAVGRTTVVAAYDTLRAEGRIVRRQGSGTRVAGSGPDIGDETTSAPMFLHLLEPHDDTIMLACAAPDAPPPELVEAYATVPARLATIAGDIGYHPAGERSLRRAIADRYSRRDTPTDPDQILVTTGAQQALSLLARGCLRPGDRTLVEAPTYPGALEAFHEAAAVVRTRPVGLDGFASATRKHRPSLAYVVASYHNPTGTVLGSLQRRRLVRAASGAGVPLVDDEVLADLGFPDETPPPPLASFGGDVISIGSLSKSVWGGLRVGWLRASTSLVRRLARLRSIHDLGGNIPAQLAAADLLPRLDDLTRRRAIELKARHDRLRAELARRLPDWQVPPARGGQTLWVRLPHGDGGSFTQVALRHGVAVLPGAGLDASERSSEYVRLHYCLETDQLIEAVRRLDAAWQAYDPPSRPRPAPAALAV